MELRVNACVYAGKLAGATKMLIDTPITSAVSSSETVEALWKAAGAALAQKQVAARMEGDVFQGMFFWWQAANLLRPSSCTARVVLEHDLASGVDDIAVFYGPAGVDAGERRCSADFFQVKYHVDQSDAYSAAALIDPAFIGAKHSLLERFATAHRKLANKDGWFRLHLVSNWHWATDDPLGPLIRESEGELPGQLLSAGSRSKLGRVRRMWSEHLRMSPHDFEDFIRRLRFGVGYFGRRHFRESLNERLVNVGLREIPQDKAQNVYDSLAQQFVMNGPHEFDVAGFRQMCEKEALLGQPPVQAQPVVGIRSFMRFAERMEDECARFVCVAKNFDRRYIRDAGLWGTIGAEVGRFLGDPAFRAQEHHLLLDCHGTLAFLAGYELDRKSGARVFPVQKGVQTTVWRPSGGTRLAEWNATNYPLNGEGTDVALAISVTRDVMPMVRTFLDGQRNFAFVIDARPSSGVGAGSIADADHAVALADRLADLVREHRPGAPARVHLFAAAPNGLLFFLGQHRAALGRIQLYEFDFEGEQGGSYSPSISLPS
jgi:hypothetical protein